MRVERPLPAEGQQARMTEVWAWTAIDPMTDVEGIISARSPKGGLLMPLIGGTRHLVERLRPYAEAVVAESEEPKPTIQLRHFVAAPEEAT